MQTLERYILRQILGPFGFFMLVLTGIIWLSQSLQIIDIVVNNGQGAQVLLELAMLRLPFALSLVLPFAATMATVYALNRMVNESEVIAALAGGASRGRLARPVIALGIVLTIIVSFVTLYLMPTTAERFRDRIAEVRADLAGGLIREGRFLFPADGLTIFVGEVTPDGRMLDVLVHNTQGDLDDPDVSAITYLAQSAQLLPRREGAQDGPYLLMGDVELQHLMQLNDGDRALQEAGYLEYRYDLSELIETGGQRLRKPSEYFFYELIFPSPEDAPTPRDVGRFISEGHEQLSAPLYGLAMPLVAAAAMFGAAFSRRGMGRAVAVALGLAVSVRVAGFAAKSTVSSAPELWPVMYAAPICAIVAALVFLARSGFRPAGPGGPTRIGPASAPSEPPPEPPSGRGEPRRRGARTPARAGPAALPPPRRGQRRDL